MANEIHPTAIIERGAELGRDVKVAPYAVIGRHVKIGDRAIVHPHAVIDGHTTLGAEVEVFPGAAVGLKPQDKKYDGSPTKLIVGDRTVIRECVTLQPGTVGTGTGITTIGSGCLIMAYCHVAHDCAVGDGVIMANATQLAGHVTIEEYAILGGVTTVHQFVRIGTRAITGASARVQQDVPPFMTADGHPARLYGLNLVGLKRAGFSKAAILALKRAYKELFLRGRYAEARAELATTLGVEHPEVARLLAFLAESKRGVTRAPAKGAAGGDDEAEGE
jgi:UDP-N-acetylglucosamine acyltransferase